MLFYNCIYIIVMVNFYYVFIGVDIVLGVLVCCVSNSYIDCILCYVLRCFFFN